MAIVRYYTDPEEASSAVLTLERFGIPARLAATTVQHLEGQAVEWEVTAELAVGTAVATWGQAIADSELDEHNVGMSTLWDDD